MMSKMSHFCLILCIKFNPNFAITFHWYLFHGMFDMGTIPFTLLTRIPIELYSVS